MNSEYKRTEGFIESKQVKLHYLDWGGKGPYLVLLCGIGDTPYLFDNLASELSSNYHVIGYSRRNHGKSKATDKNFDNTTLVSDLKLLLDSLKINKASLLGWSMGGNEITEFASRYPERVDKLIYFEAGYDLSDEGFKKLQSSIPVSFLPDNKAMKSLDNYREWCHHFWFGDMEWNNALEANLLITTQIGADGSIETIPDENTFKLILKEAMNYKRNYEHIQAPSLVIYTKPFFYPVNNNPDTVQTYDSIERNIVSPWRAESKKQIEKELKNVVFADAPHGTHSSLLFLSEDFLLTTIRNFLSEK